MFNSEAIQNFTLGAAATVPIIVAIVQACKLTGWVKDKYAPFLSMFVGMGVTMLLTHDFMSDLSGTILTGILFGLASSGLYSGIKTTAQAIKIQESERLMKKQNKQQHAQSKAQKQEEPQPECKK